MNSRRNGKKWTLVALLLALASFATMGFTVVDRGEPGVTVLPDHVPCALVSGFDGLYLPMDLVHGICEAADFGTSLIEPSVLLVDDSQAWFDQYGAALEQTEQFLNEQYLAARQFVNR